MLCAECQKKDWKNGHKRTCPRIWDSKKGTVSARCGNLELSSSHFGAKRLNKVVKKLSKNYSQRLANHRKQKKSELEKQHRACFVPGTVCEGKLGSDGRWRYCVVRSVDRGAGTADIRFLNLDVATLPMHHMRWTDHQARDRRGRVCGDDHSYVIMRVVTSIAM